MDAKWSPVLQPLVCDPWTLSLKSPLFMCLLVTSTTTLLLQEGLPWPHRLNQMCSTHSHKVPLLCNSSHILSLRTRAVALIWGQFRLPGNIHLCLETLVEGSANTMNPSGMLLTILQCTGQPPQKSSGPNGWLYQGWETLSCIYLHFKNKNEIPLYVYFLITCVCKLRNNFSTLSNITSPLLVCWCLQERKNNFMVSWNDELSTAAFFHNYMSLTSNGYMKIYSYNIVGHLDCSHPLSFFS